MAKKFGKFLLFTAAVGTAAAAVYYHMQKKDTVSSAPEDEDYDDFSENSDADADTSRNYVPLTSDGKTEEKPEEKKVEESNTFTPLEQVAKTAEDAADAVAETVEEFFDEESTTEEPPIQDNE